ncbi:MAG: hypothetical protein ABL997_18955 [Planctomycetota bacterium]
MDKNASERAGEHFQAAIARHQLDLQTQLKRTTSLPSAMFDATDPMLEARLCEATEGIFRQLLEFDTPQPIPTDGEMRLEGVSPQELATVLDAAVRGEFADSESPELSEHQDAEFVAILAEAAARSRDQAKQRAVELLAERGSNAARDLDSLASSLIAQLLAIDPDTGGDARQEARLKDLCNRVAETVIRSLPSALEDDLDGDPA